MPDLLEGLQQEFDELNLTFELQLHDFGAELNHRQRPLACALRQWVLWWIHSAEANPIRRPFFDSSFYEIELLFQQHFSHYWDGLQKFNDKIEAIAWVFETDSDFSDLMQTAHSQLLIAEEFSHAYGINPRNPVA